MNWRNPRKEMPPQDAIIWVVYQHGKEHVPMSCQIMAGEVGYGEDKSQCQVCTMDMTGQGSWSTYLYAKDAEIGDEDRYSSIEEGLAWCYADDLLMPPWIEHDKWWGKDHRVDPAPRP